MNNVYTITLYTMNNTEPVWRLLFIVSQLTSPLIPQAWLCLYPCCIIILQPHNTDIYLDNAGMFSQCPVPTLVTLWRLDNLKATVHGKELDATSCPRPSCPLSGGHFEQVIDPCHGQWALTSSGGCKHLTSINLMTRLKQSIKFDIGRFDDSTATRGYPLQAGFLIYLVYSTRHHI